MLPQQVLQKQFDDNAAIIEKLKSYGDRNISDLSDSLRQEIKRNITVGKFITASGLESVDTILTKLYVANHYLEQAINDPQGFEQKYTHPAQAPQPSNLSEPQKETIKINLNPSTPKPPTDTIGDIHIKLPSSNSPSVSPKVTPKQSQIVPPPPAGKIEL